MKSNLSGLTLLWELMKTIYIITRDSNLDNAKTLAELVDNKLARYYELDDSGKKKVRWNKVFTE